MTKTATTIQRDIQTLSDHLIDWLAERATADIRHQGYSSWALSGGSTPVPLYERLSRASTIPWSHINLFLVDERNVEPWDTLSNYRMIRETLLDALPIAPKAVYRWLTGADPREALTQYRSFLAPLHRTAGYPVLDVALLGMGEDGHTASVFPGSPQEDNDDWVAFGPGPGADRFTLTLPLLARARHTAFLVTGSKKADLVARILNQPASPLPAARLTRNAPAVTWFLDDASAAKL